MKNKSRRYPRTQSTHLSEDIQGVVCAHISQYPHRQPGAREWVPLEEAGGNFQESANFSDLEIHTRQNGSRTEPFCHFFILPFLPFCHSAVSAISAVAHNWYFESKTQQPFFRLRMYTHLLNYTTCPHTSSMDSPSTPPPSPTTSEYHP